MPEMPKQAYPTALGELPVKRVKFVQARSGAGGEVDLVDQTLRSRSKTARAARRFFVALIQSFPIRIRTILTDNDEEFTDRFVTQGEHTQKVSMPLTDCVKPRASSIGSPLCVDVRPAGWLSV